jgi:hypothetical protein
VTASAAIGSLLTTRVVVPVDPHTIGHGRTWTVHGDTYTVAFTTEDRYVAWATGEPEDERYLHIELAALAAALRDGIGLIIDPLTPDQQHFTPDQLAAYRTDLTTTPTT